MKIHIVGGKGPAKTIKPVVVSLGNVTKLDLPVDRVLEGAKDRLDAVVILGRQHDGEYYFASSVADGGTVLWMMEKLRMELLGVK